MCSQSIFVSTSAQTGNERIVKIDMALLLSLIHASSLLTTFARILTYES